MGGQHVPRPQLARVCHTHTCTDVQVADVGRVKVVVILVETKLAGVRQIWNPRKWRKLDPVEEDQVLENGTRHRGGTGVFKVQVRT